MDFSLDVLAFVLASDLIVAGLTGKFVTLGRGARAERPALDYPLRSLERLGRSSPPPFGEGDTRQRKKLTGRIESPET